MRGVTWRDVVDGSTILTGYVEAAQLGAVLHCTCHGHATLYTQGGICDHTSSWVTELQFWHTLWMWCARLVPHTFKLARCTQPCRAKASC